ncbi:MAG: dephospho-CoA kinase [Christensenellales bacterium]
MAEIHRQLDQFDAPGQIVVGDIPLLYECGMETLFDTVWVVRADRETQIQRLFERDGLSREQAERRINSQMPLDEKIRRANAVIDTSGTIEQTQKQVDGLLESVAASAAPVRRRRPHRRSISPTMCRKTGLPYRAAPFASCRLRRRILPAASAARPARDRRLTVCPRPSAFSRWRWR